MRTAADIMDKEFFSIDSSRPLSEAISRLGQGDPVVIMDGDDVRGIFSRQSLLKARADVTKLKLARVTRAVPLLAPEDDLLRVAAMLHDADASFLPVVEKGKCVGVVRSLELLKYLKELPELRELKVRDIRHPEPAVVREDEGLDSALSMMHDRGVDRLAVVDGSGKAAGFLAYLDVLRNYYAHPPNSDYGQHSGHGHQDATAGRTRGFEAQRPDVPELPVGDFMTKDLFVIDEEETVRGAAEQLIARGVLSLLIMHDAVPRGIVTHKDLLEAALNSQAPIAEHIAYVGLDKCDIDSFERLQVTKICSRNAHKLQRYFENEFQLTVHIKEISKEGERHQYTAHLRITYPGSTVPSTKGTAWNVRSALQDGFNRLDSKLRRKYKWNVKEKTSERKTGRVMPGTLEPGEQEGMGEA